MSDVSAVWAEEVASTAFSACKHLGTSSRSPAGFAPFLHWTSDYAREESVWRIVCGCLLSFGVLAVTAVSADNWPQWRGPQLNGTADEKGLPVKWSSTENIAWKLAMPSRTGATPIVWNDRIFLNVATEDGGGAGRAVVRGPRQGHRPVEAPDRGRQLPDQQTEHVVAVAGDRRHQRVGPDRPRHSESVRLRRQGAVDARHSEGLRDLRAELGLRILSAPAPGRAVRAGPPRDEDGRPVVPDEDRQEDRQDALEDGASDRRRSRSRRMPIRRRRCSSTATRQRS